MWWDAANSDSPQQQQRNYAQRPPALQAISSLIPSPSLSPHVARAGGGGGAEQSSSSTYHYNTMNPLSFQRSYLIGVTMLSKELWLSVTAASIDELCSEVEKELTARGELMYLDVLYLLCVTSTDDHNNSSSGNHHQMLQSSPDMMSLSMSQSSSSPLLGTPSNSLLQSTFALCAVRRREETEQVLHKKGRRGRAVVITDADQQDQSNYQNHSSSSQHNDPRRDLFRQSPSSTSPSSPPSSSVLNSQNRPSAISRIPTKFSCVVRCTPRSITLNVLCVLSPLVRTELGPIRSLDGPNEHQATLTLPVDSEVVEHWLQSRPSEIFRVRTIAADVTSLSEIGIAVYQQLEPLLRLYNISQDHQDNSAAPSHQDRLRRVVTTAMQLYYMNPRDRRQQQQQQYRSSGGGGFGGGEQSDSYRVFSPLLHVAQLAGLAHIICDLSSVYQSVGTLTGSQQQLHHYDDTPRDATVNWNSSNGGGGGGRGESQLRSKLLEIARSKPSHSNNPPHAAPRQHVTSPALARAESTNTRSIGHHSERYFESRRDLPSNSNVSVLDTIRNRATAGQQPQSQAQTLSPSRRRDPAVSFASDEDGRNSWYNTPQQQQQQQVRSNYNSGGSSPPPPSQPYVATDRRRSASPTTHHHHHDVYYHRDHLQRLGIAPSSVNDYLVPSKREEEVDNLNGSKHYGLHDAAGASIDGLADAWQVLPVSFGDGGERRRVSGSIVGDALREGATRFPGYGEKHGNVSLLDSRAQHLQTPLKRRTPPAAGEHNGANSDALSTSDQQQQQHYVSLDSKGQVISRRQATTEAEEKRALIQVSLHMLLSHPRRGAFPTSTLVTLIPNVVQSFRDQYLTTGIPLRFPLSQGDTRDLQKIVDESIAYEIAANPNLPFLLENAATKTNRNAPSPPRRTTHGNGASSSPNFFEIENDVDDDDDIIRHHRSTNGGYRDVSDTPPMVDRLPAAPPAAHHVLILAKPFFDAQTKRLLVYATVGIDIFDGPSAAIHQSSRPYYATAAGASGAVVGGSTSPRRAATKNGAVISHLGQLTTSTATIPFRWFLRTTKAHFNDAPSKELPIDTFFALGIAKTHILSYTVPITVNLELNLDPEEDWSHIGSGQERVLVHRWRAGGVANVLTEGQEYVVGIEIHRRDVPHELSMANGGVEGEFIQATQAFVIPVGSGAAPQSRAQMYDMLVS